jgi:hypothetical protein
MFYRVTLAVVLAIALSVHGSPLSSPTGIEANASTAANHRSALAKIQEPAEANLGSSTKDKITVARENPDVLSECGSKVIEKIFKVSHKSVASFKKDMLPEILHEFCLDHMLRVTFPAVDLISKKGAKLLVIAHHNHTCNLGFDALKKAHSVLSNPLEVSKTFCHHIKLLGWNPLQQPKSNVSTTLRGNAPTQQKGVSPVSKHQGKKDQTVKITFDLAGIEPEQFAGSAMETFAEVLSKFVNVKKDLVKVDESKRPILATRKLEQESGEFKKRSDATLRQAEEAAAKKASDIYNSVATTDNSVATTDHNTIPSPTMASPKSQLEQELEKVAKKESVPALPANSERENALKNQNMPTANQDPTAEPSEFSPPPPPPPKEAEPSETRPPSLLQINALPVLAIDAIVAGVSSTTADKIRKKMKDGVSDFATALRDSPSAAFRGLEAIELNGPIEVQDTEPHVKNRTMVQKHVKNAKLKDCPVDTYRKTKAGVCVKCPLGTTTEDAIGATSIKQCVNTREALKKNQQLAAEDIKKIIQKSKGRVKRTAWAPEKFDPLRGLDTALEGDHQKMNVTHQWADDDAQKAAGHVYGVNIEFDINDREDPRKSLVQKPSLLLQKNEAQNRQAPTIDLVESRAAVRGSRK